MCYKDYKQYISNEMITQKLTKIDNTEVTLSSAHFACSFWTGVLVEMVSI